MNGNTADNRKTNSRLVLTSVFVVAGLWFAFQIISVLFLFFFAIVLTLILNAPTMWLVSKNFPRTAAALLVFFAMLLFLAFLGWLVIPRVLEQISILIKNLPDYFDRIKDQLSSLLQDYPSLHNKVMEETDPSANLPSAAAVMGGLSRFSLSFLGAVVMLIIFFSIVVYMLINPKPLVETYLFFFPHEKRQKAANALANASTMMVGWMWSNLLVGSMEALAVYIFLSFMNVPGVWVWAALALFAEMVPKLGLYIMAIPPTLIALSVSPSTALWVLVFYLVLNEIMGDFVMPRIRASTMNLHPVSSLFLMLVMASAFGLVGALIATPLTAFIKAFYEEFYISSTKKTGLDEQVETVLNRGSK